MGGGDLNSKKSWHPNTMKNQERVWKAEQASAEEKKRILELQRERADERDRAELNDLAKRTAGSSGANDNRLHWMYDKPDKKVQQEDFLLGKAIDSNYEADKASQQEYIPAVARRVGGSSMLASAGDAQVDLARKMREDPLMLVKERERAARAALLNNPLQRRRLAELLRKEQEERNERKEKKKPKKDKDLDNMLAAKLNALGEKQIDLATLLASNDSSSDSSPEEEQTKSKKKHKKSKKHKKEKKKAKRNDTDEESLRDDDTDRHQHKHRDQKRSSPHWSGAPKSSRKDSGRNDSDYEQNVKKYKRSEKTESRLDKDQRARRDSTERRRRPPSEEGRPAPRHSPGRRATRRSEERRPAPRPSPGRRATRSSEERHTPQDRRMEPGKYKRKAGMSEDERMAKLAAMVAAGAERERERGARVAGQRAADAVAERSARAHGPRAPVAPALPDSLESRIHSNRHYIQRDRSHMDRPFARR